MARLSVAALNERARELHTEVFDMVAAQFEALAAQRPSADPSELLEEIFAAAGLTTIDAVRILFGAWVPFPSQAEIRGLARACGKSRTEQRAIARRWLAARAVQAVSRGDDRGGGSVVRPAGHIRPATGVREKISNALPGGDAVSNPSGDMNYVPELELKRVRRRYRWIVVIVAVVALLAGGGASYTLRGNDVDDVISQSPDSGVCEPVTSDARNQANGVLKLGAMVPSSGSSLASQDLTQRAAYELATKDINDAGGIPGLQFTFSPSDVVDEGVPGSSTSCESLNRLLSAGSGVDTIIGPTASSDVFRVLNRTIEAGVIAVSPAATAPELSEIDDDGMFFRTVPSDVLQGRILADTVIGESGPKPNIVVIARGDGYGRGLQDEVTNELDGFDVGSVRSLNYDPASTADFKPVVDAVVNGGPKPTAIIFIGFDELAPLIQQLLAAQINPRNTRFYGADGLVRDTFPNLVGLNGRTELVGMRGTKPLLPNSFVGAITAFRKNVQDFTYAPQAYDATIVVALAAAQAGRDDTKEISRVIPAVTRAGTKCFSYATCVALLKNNPKADIDYDGVSGPLDFTGTGEPCQGYYSLVSYGEQMKFAEYGRAFGTFLCTGRP